MMSTVTKKKNKKKLLPILSDSNIPDLQFVGESDTRLLKAAFENAVHKYPEIKFVKTPLNKHKLKSKDKETDTKQENNEPKAASFSLKEFIFLGINEVLKAVSNKKCCGVILTNPITTTLQLALNKSCLDNEISCINVNGFDGFSTILNISSLTSLAFKNNISDCSQLREIYNCFVQIARPAVNKVTHVKQDELPPQPVIPVHRKFTFKLPSFEQLYMTSPIQFEESSSDDNIISVQGKQLFPNRVINYELDISVNVYDDGDTLGFVNELFADVPSNQKANLKRKKDKSSHAKNAKSGESGHSASNKKVKQESARYFKSPEITHVDTTVRVDKTSSQKKNKKRRKKK